MRENENMVNNNDVDFNNQQPYDSNNFNNATVVNQPSDDSFPNVNTTSEVNNSPIQNENNSSEVQSIPEINTTNMNNGYNYAPGNEENNNYDVSTPLYEEVEIKRSPQELRTDSYFDGKLLELIGWTLLRNLLAIITLGIALPWGQCMLMKYQTEHTVLNGKRLKFEGTGGSLFVEKFKWFFFSIITLGIYIFFIPVKRYKWILSNIHFEDENLVSGESFFDGKTLHLVGINILCNFLNVLSFGLLYAFTWCFKLRWLAKHSVINRKKIVFDGKALNLFGKYILWFFLTIITFGIYAFWLGIKLSKWEVKNTHIKMANEVYQKDKSLIWLVLGFIVLGIIATLIISSIDFTTIRGTNNGGLFDFIANGGATGANVNEPMTSDYGLYSTYP